MAYIPMPKGRGFTPLLDKIYDWGKFLHGEIVSISMTKKQFLMKIRVNHNVSWKRPMKRYPISALGKTVFPISAEAEAEQEGE